MSSSRAATVVMGTGIVSFTLHLDGERILSPALLIVTAGTWIGMTLLLLRDGIELAPAAFALVAATAVLGSRLVVEHARPAGAVLLIFATVLWVGCAISARRGGALPHTGSSFLLSVSIQSLAVLGALLASSPDARWLSWPALGGWIAGLVAYGMVLHRFDPRQLRTGHGDQWVAGGALAIAAVTAADLSADDPLRPLVTALHVAGLVVWAAGIGWLIVLVASELRYPRLRYDAQRWSTVFPVGMYAAASFEVARAAGVPLIGSFASVWTWVSVGVWAMVAGGMLRAAISSGQPPRSRSATL